MHVAYTMATIIFHLLPIPDAILSGYPIATDLKDFDLLGKWILGQRKRKKCYMIDKHRVILFGRI